jgi:hypothetical protein
LREVISIKKWRVRWPSIMNHFWFTYFFLFRRTH